MITSKHLVTDTSFMKKVIEKDFQNFMGISKITLFWLCYLLILKEKDLLIYMVKDLIQPNPESGFTCTIMMS
jgi:hypothetical protein